VITFPAGCEIFVIHESVSFGRGIDGMCALCRAMLGKEPLSSAYFLFRNRSRSQVRVLWYDGQGLSLCTKRLSMGTFPVWPSAPGASSLVAWHAAQALLAGAASIGAVPEWKKIRPS
jgi:transposase